MQYSNQFYLPPNSTSVALEGFAGIRDKMDPNLYFETIDSLIVSDYSEPLVIYLIEEEAPVAASMNFNDDLLFNDQF